MDFFEIFILVIFLVILTIGFRSEFFSNLPNNSNTNTYSQANESCGLKQGLWYPYYPDDYNNYWGWKPYNGLRPYYNPWWYYPYPYPTPINYNSCASKLR